MRRQFNDGQKIENQAALRGVLARISMTTRGEVAHDADVPPATRFLDRLTRPSNANEMARSSSVPPDIHEVARVRAAGYDDPTAIAMQGVRPGMAGAASLIGMETQVWRDHKVTGAGQDNFRGVNHFPQGHVGRARFERGLPPGYAGYMSMQHLRTHQNQDSLAFKIGSEIPPPSRYSPDRVPRERPREAWSAGGVRRDTSGRFAAVRV